MELVVQNVTNKNEKKQNNSHWLSLCNQTCSFATCLLDLQPATSNCNLPQFCIKGGVVRQERTDSISYLFFSFIALVVYW